MAAWEFVYVNNYYFSYWVMNPPKAGTSGEKECKKKKKGDTMDAYL